MNSETVGYSEIRGLPGINTLLIIAYTVRDVPRGEAPRLAVEGARRLGERVVREVERGECVLLEAAERLQQRRERARVEPVAREREALQRHARGGDGVGDGGDALQVEPVGGEVERGEVRARVQQLWLARSALKIDFITLYDRFPSPSSWIL